jgi:hypothetical protein
MGLAFGSDCTDPASLVVVVMMMMMMMMMIIIIIIITTISSDALSLSSLKVKKMSLLPVQELYQ